MTEKTIFSKIIDGEIPARKLYEDEQCIVIEDIQPKAPTHLLIIPKQPIPMLSQAMPEHQALLGHLLLVVGEMARRTGCGDGFRLVINNGKGGGQTVFHLHMHLLGNKKFNEDDLAS